MSPYIFERTISLDRPVREEAWRVPARCGDRNAHEIRMRLLRDGTPIALDGVEIRLHALRSDGEMIVVPGTAEGEFACAVLSEACTAVPGPLHLTLILSEAGRILTGPSVRMRVMAGTETASLASNGGNPFLAMGVRISGSPDAQQLRTLWIGTEAAYLAEPTDPETLYITEDHFYLGATCIR